MIKNAMTNLNSFVLKCKRVWMILRKPTSDEFNSVAKISAIGILVIGLIGFVISDLIELFT
jgi:protein transport protein SEC61 subunit gamma-like protein